MTLLRPKASQGNDGDVRGFIGSVCRVLCVAILLASAATLVLLVVLAFHS